MPCNRERKIFPCWEIQLIIITSNLGWSSFPPPECFYTLPSLSHRGQSEVFRNKGKKSASVVLISCLRPDAFIGWLIGDCSDHRATPTIHTYDGYALRCQRESKGKQITPKLFQALQHSERRCLLYVPDDFSEKLQSICGKQVRKHIANFNLTNFQMHVAFLIILLTQSYGRSIHVESNYIL